MLITLVGFVLRVLYVWMAQVDYPIRGDVNQYVLYAWNLVHRGVFSTALPDAAGAAPDSYRGPGYPLFLALNMWLAGHSDLPLRPGPNGLQALGYVTDTWMRYALAGQVVLSTATVALSMAMARLWLSRAAVLVAGFLVALWPHLITFAGSLLSETLFAFTIVLSLYLACVAQSRSSLLLTMSAGACFGCAYLVNPVIALFPPLLAALLWVRMQRRAAIILLVTFAIAPSLWAVRNTGIVGENSDATLRAAQNLVQGSIPQYFTAYNSRLDNPISKQIVDLASDETQLLIAHPAAGLAEIVDRMRQDPAFYAKWYLFDKPYQLWDWEIRIGAGDIYFLETQHSPFERIPALKSMKYLIRSLNPVLFLLAAGAMFVLVWQNFRRPSSADVPPSALALLFLYVTLLHLMFQAEPRYAIPFRPVELLLAVTAVTASAHGLLRRRAKE